MAADHKIFEQILCAVPQQPPFRFIDEILELDEEHIVGSYRFREDEYFYQGHFPQWPVTPGVVLIETMAQTGVVAFGIYLLMKQGLSTSKINQLVTLFTLVDQVEFNGIVNPGEKVIIKGQKIYFRKRNLKSRVSIVRQNGEEICYGILTGSGVNINEK